MLTAPVEVGESHPSYAIHELWGSGVDYSTLHEDIKQRTTHLWRQHEHESFRFEIDSFHGSRSLAAQRDIIESFAYTDFKGRIALRNPDSHFIVFEEYDLNGATPNRLYFGRQIAESGRKAVQKYSLKKRKYIATTSMDAELSLVTANLALAGPGKIAYDPFVGTGSFPLACAHFGAAVMGSDLDGRSIRGVNPGRNVRSNFVQCGTTALYLGSFVSDLTHSPLRAGAHERWLDAIVCDPPYGIREGLKVLGSTKAALQEEVLLDTGQPAHLSDSYIPPKKPYSFTRMLDDVLDFGAQRLVDGGRLCMWMPVAGASDDANDQDVEREQEAMEYAIPSHPQLELVSECVQQFNKWSRRLLTYRRLRDAQVDPGQLQLYTAHRMSMAQGDQTTNGGTADDLNAFRRRYFQGFK